MNYLDRPILIREVTIHIHVRAQRYAPPVIDVPPAPQPRPMGLLGRIFAAPWILLAIAWALGSLQ